MIFDPVPVKKPLTESAAVLDAAKAVRELRPMGFRDSQVGQYLFFVFGVRIQFQIPRVRFDRVSLHPLSLLRLARLPLLQRRSHLNSIVIAARSLCFNDSHRLVELKR